MANTYTAIATTTLASAATTYNFTSIPQTYTDLVFTITGLGDTNDYVIVRPNSDSSALYSRTWMYGNGSSAASARGSNETAFYIDAGYGTSSTPANSVTHIMNYSNTTTYKTALNRSASLGGPGAYAFVYLYRSTSAITSLQVNSPSTNGLQAGTVLTLYGIKAA